MGLYYGNGRGDSFGSNGLVCMSSVRQSYKKYRGLSEYESEERKRYQKINEVGGIKSDTCTNPYTSTSVTHASIVQ
eukprot:5426548-Amphidinium_carterae.1